MIRPGSSKQDLDGSLARLRLRRGHPCPQLDLTARRSHGHPVHRTQQLRHRVRGNVGDPGVQRLLGGEGSIDLGEIHLPPMQLEPAFDRLRHPRGLAIGMQDVHRLQRPRLGTGRDGRERRGEHQQEARAARFRRHRAHPGEHGHLEGGDAVSQSDPVLAERSRSVELQDHDRARPFRVGQPFLQVRAEWAVDRPLDLDHVHRRRLRGSAVGPRAPDADRHDRGDDQGARVDGGDAWGRIVSSKRSREIRRILVGPMSVDTGRRPAGPPRHRGAVRAPALDATPEPSVTGSRSSRSPPCCSSP